MDEIKPVNFSKPRKKQSPKRLYLKMIGIFLVIFIALIIGTNSTTPEVFNTIFGKGPTFEVDRGRVNVLLVGMAGGTHEGAMLTDTIIVASVNLSNKQVDLISLPRDLWLDQHKAKINTLYQEGLKADKDGLEYARLEIGKILGIKIPYAVRADFSGFTKAVDLVDGIEVEVQNSFDDYLYPIEGKKNEMCGYSETEKDLNEEEAKALNIAPGKYQVLITPDGKIATTSAMINPGSSQKPQIIYGPEDGYRLFTCRYEHIHFDKGMNKMSGELALKFVRSRTGNNGEGSDFARSKRQQLVISAFKQKVLSLNTLTNPSKIVSLLKTFENSIETDIPSNDYLDFVNLGREVGEIKTHVIDFSGTDPLLITPRSGNYGGAWVLVPKAGNFSEIQKFVDKTLFVLPTPTP